MATISSNGTGGGVASSGASWSGGVAPVFGDKVTIASGDTITLNFSPFVITAGSGYLTKPTVTLGGATGSGATAVAIMSNVNGTGSVVGIKVTAPGASYTVPTVTFTGGSPAVAATATATVYNGRFAYSLGDDTTTAVNINSGGTLKWSTTVSTSIAFYGSCVTSNGGTFNMGTSGAPIAYGVSHSIFLNDSAALAAIKYGIECIGAGINTFTIFGAAKTINTYLSSTANSAQATIIVNDATGWEVGDRVWIAPTTNVSTQTEEKTITAISGTTITLNSNLTNQHTANGRVGNADNNLIIAPVTVGAASQYPGYISIFNGSTTVANSREIQYCTFEQGGDGTTGNKYAALLIQSNSLTTLAVSAFKKIANCCFRNTGTPTTASISLMLRANFVTFPLEDCAFYSSASTGVPLNFRNGGNIAGNRCFFYKSIQQEVLANFEQGSIGASFANSYFLGSTQPAIGINQGTLSLDTCYIDCSGTAMNSSFLSSITMSKCQIGTTFGGFSTTSMFTGSIGALQTWVFTDTYFGSTPSSMFNSSGQAVFNPNSSLNIVNKGADVTAQEIYLPYGNFFRDNSVFNRSISSIRAETSVTSNAFSESTIFLAASGVTYTLIGYLRKNSTYGGSTMPTVKLSGAGITPSTFTMSNSVDTWEKFTLTGTQTTGAAANLTFTFTVQSANITGIAYCDGIILSPLVIATRHYGYKIDSNIYRTLDSVISQTNETTVGAYTGISIAGTTITITGTRTIRELYDYCHWHNCQSANLSEPEFFTSTDGINFTSTYNITINGGSLTGTGTISMPTKTLTLSGGGTTSIIITDATGTHVYVTLTGMTANSRVQLYNLDTSTELYNAVVAATSLSFPFTWTTNVNLRVRIMYVSGITANIFYEVNAVITNVGVSLVVIPVNDTVYNGNGIDGSTITNVSINDSAMLVNVSTGTISWKSLYAYETYWLGTSAGIIDLGRFASAVDGSNYVWTGFKIKNTTSPSVPLNITGGWGRDSVTGLAQTLVDTTGGNVFSNPDQVIAFGSGLTPAQDAELTAIKSNTDLIPATI